MNPWTEFQQQRKCFILEHFSQAVSRQGDLRGQKRTADAALRFGRSLTRCADLKALKKCIADDIVASSSAVIVADAIKDINPGITRGLMSEGAFSLLATALQDAAYRILTREVLRN